MVETSIAVKTIQYNKSADTNVHIVTSTPESFEAIKMDVRFWAWLVGVFCGEYWRLLGRGRG